MSRFIIAIEASADLDEIGDYFLDRSVDAGELWFQAFNQNVNILPNIRAFDEVIQILDFI